MVAAWEVQNTAMRAVHAHESSTDPHSVYLTPARAAALFGAIASASIPFTDGETARRVTISDAAVTATSKILGSIVRPTAAEAADEGYIYTANVISRATGTFDLLVIVRDWGMEDATLDPPNETVTYVYQVAA